jgi:hypothetical protein
VGTMKNFSREQQQTGFVCGQWKHWHSHFSYSFLAEMATLFIPDGKKITLERISRISNSANSLFVTKNDEN